MRGLLLLQCLVGCGTTAVPGPATIPRLTAARDSVLASDGLVLSADAVTNANWRQYGQLIGKVAVRLTDTSSQGTSLGTAPGAVSSGTPGTKLRYEDFLLLPLPTFHVRISNVRKQAIDLSQARFKLEDDRGRVIQSLDATGVQEELERKIILWRNRHENGISPEQLTDLRAATRRVPVFSSQGGVDSGADWSGYVTFRLESDHPIQHLALVLEGVTAGGQPLAALRMPFVVQRRHAARACPDGSLASPLGECKGDDQETSPVNDGPCIQKTRMVQSEKRAQWWIGGEPVADSDLNRTLEQRPSSAAMLRRGTILRGLGYGLVGGGLLLSGLTALGIAVTGNSKLAPAGLSFIAVSIVGFGIGYSGAAHTERAVRIYNEESDGDGNCSVSW